MVNYVTRATIRLRAPRGGGRSLSPSKVKNVAFHWPGMAKPINAVGAAGMARVCSALRGWQSYHMDVRGWSDIAYQVAIDQEGRAYTLRGVNIQSGANGNETVNETYGAVLLVLAPGEQPSGRMAATAKLVQADFKSRFPMVPNRPTKHKSVRPAGTDCPGPLAIKAIDSGMFDAGKPVPTPPPVRPDGDKRPRNSKGQLSMSFNALIYALDHEVSGVYGSYRDAAMESLKYLGDTKAAAPYTRIEFRGAWYAMVDRIKASANKYAFEWFVDACGFWPPDTNDWPDNAKDR